MSSYPPTPSPILSSTFSPISSPQQRVETARPSTSKERARDIAAVVRGVTNEKHLRLKNSPQRRAYDWIVHDDSAQLQLEGDGNESAIVQRYILATLKFSLDGEGIMGLPSLEKDEEEGRGGIPWLSAENECFWKGVHCGNTSLVDPLLNLYLHETGSGVDDDEYDYTGDEYDDKIADDDLVIDMGLEQWIQNEKGDEDRSQRETGNEKRKAGGVVNDDDEESLISFDDIVDDMEGISKYQKMTSNMWAEYYGWFNKMIEQEEVETKSDEYSMRTGKNNDNRMRQLEIGRERQRQRKQLSSLIFKNEYSGNGRTTTSNDSKGSQEKDNYVITALNLSKLNLTGAIPSELGSLSPTIFTSISLSHNTLSGWIPPTLSLLQGLQELDFSHNEELSGTIPQEFVQLANLRLLDVRSTLVKVFGNKGICRKCDGCCLLNNDNT